MNSPVARYIDVDWNRFEPWRIQPVRHRVQDHPLLQPDQLIELGKRLEVQSLTRTHTNDATADTPFDNAPRLHPNKLTAAETLQHIQSAKAWMSLLNVQTDPLYRTFVREVLDDVQPEIEKRDPGMCYRAGWIFVSSPKTITPFHMDTEHNFILQMRGKKTIYVWEHDDLAVVSEKARNRFHGHHSRELMIWRDEFRGQPRRTRAPARQRQCSARRARESPPELKVRCVEVPVLPLRGIAPSTHCPNAPCSFGRTASVQTPISACA